MEKDYLTISRAGDLQTSKERIVYKLFEALPAFLSLGSLGLAFALSWLAPVAVAVFIIAFDIFWLLRISYLSFHQLSSYRQMKKNLKIDWLAKLKTINPKPHTLNVKSWQDVYHLIILPMYKEGIEIVRPTLQSLIDSEYPKEKMIVVLALEERGGEAAQKVSREIEREFGKRFFRFLATVHPKDISGEMAGKGSNVFWAIKKAKELIVELGINSENIIVSNFDIDTRPYSQYFAVLTWHYLTVKKPLRSSYQPIPIYNNNIWQASSFSRVIATSGTFWQMMQQERPEQLVTYSSHSLPLKVLEEVSYPANMVSDDSRIFWKAYLKYDGDYRVIPLHYPVSMDAVMAKNLGRTIINQYKQQRRWAFGCENIPYLLFGFLKNKKIGLGEKLRQTFVILDGFWSWAVSALLIFFLGWLPLFAGGQEFNYSLLSYNLPKLTSNLMSLAMVGMIVSSITSFLLLPPRPKQYGCRKNLSVLFQWLLLPFTLIVFGSFPCLEAQIRLFSGKYLGFWVTEKVLKP
ncbi:MAG: glycosyltransferase family 2 protein [bacterium]